MRIISVLKIRQYAEIVGIFLIIAALITGIPVSYDVGGDTRTLSDNLEIRTWYDLDAIRDNLDGNHILMNDLDSTTAGYDELASPTANQGKGWDPIGFVTNFTPIPTPGIACSPPMVPDVAPPWHGLTGSFDGQGHEIRDLFINRPDDSHIALFLINDWGFIKDVGVVNITVIGGDCVGGLVGENGGTVSNSYSTGNVTGTWMVGGLAGLNFGTVSNSYSTGNVTGNSHVGGLVGWNYWGTVSYSYSTSDVSGYSSVGGLVGFNYYATVSNSYSSGIVTGNKDVGGLVGKNMGLNYFSDILNSYSTSDVTGDVRIGGLLGYNHYGTISNSYSTGNVSGNEDVGGLLGLNDESTVSNSFWDTETSGQIYSDGGTGKNTTEMQDIMTFSGAGWNIITVSGIGERNITYIWNIVNNVTYPFLSWQSVKIRDWYDLDAIRNDLDGSYVLINNLDSTTAGYDELASPTSNGGKGWQPIGNFTRGNFTGSFDGKGYEIRDLFINRTDETAVGLFSTVGEGGVIRNVGAVNADVTGEYCVGALVGFDFEGAVSNCYATGSVTGELNGVGSLVGISGGTVSNCYSSGNVTGNHIVGGLVGAICGFEMAAKYGLPSSCGNGTVSESYSTCSVSGNSFIGGLVGLNGGPVSNSYSTFSVTGNSSVGGLVGENCGGTVSNSYSTGNVTGNSSVGGLVGHDDGGTVTNSFWDIETSGQNVSAGGTGKNTTEMKNIMTFSVAGWNITTVGSIGERNITCIWNIVNGVIYPFLSWEP